jgi:hypothetical protein
MVLDIPTIVLVRFFGRNLVLTYDNESKNDGLGAQIQRVLGIAGLANLLHTGYLHTGIKNVAVHPLDPYQEKEDYFKFISEVNKFLAMPSSTHVFFTKDSGSTQESRSPSRRSLIRAAVSSWPQKTARVYPVVEPYFMIDTWPNHYRHCLSQLTRKLEPLNRCGDSPKVVIHYRWGVGGMAIQNGEKFPRELPLKYFLSVLDQLVRQNGGLPLESLTVLTDAPESEVIFEPPSDQAGLWEGSPSFEAGKMYVKGADFFDVFIQYAKEVKIVRGGSALEAIKRMANAEVLVLSKSSLSYVAGILNNSGTIYYPPNFWHPRLRGWKKL